MWDSEVLTASDGSHFYMPIQTNLSWNVLKQNGEAEEYTRRKVIFTSARPMTFQAILKAEEKFLTDNLEDEDTDALDNDSSPTSLSKSAEKSGFQLTNFNEVDLSNADDFTLIISDDTLKVSNQKIKFLYENDAVLASVPMTSGMTKLNPTVPGTLMLYHLLGQLTSNKVWKFLISLYVLLTEMSASNNWYRTNHGSCTSFCINSSVCLDEQTYIDLPFSYF